ncbi:ankyrin repeat-containing protein [Anaeramoeba ignava]|uniref:Ankyrin repeat-containing protein n=1 Tax=Anaeramoeba ignava TaxID=1746090 RepID=A0A9Q0R647_ANAIG|nr:ankyrin repeat-containing protein [Anaeramoeba ignava]
MNNLNLWDQIKQKNIQFIKNINSIQQNELKKNSQPILNFALENKNSLEMIQLLISKGANPNSTDKKQKNALHSAILNKCELEIIEFLINSKIEINSIDDEKKTALDYSINIQRENQMEIVKLLVENGADVNIATHQSKYPLHFACQIENSFEIVKFLVEKGADINVKNIWNETPLHLACQQKSFKIITFLIEKGADINLQTSLVFNDKYLSPLHIACKKNSFNIVKLLIEKEAKINIKTQEEETPLHFACQQNSFEIVKFLVEKGADINAQSIWNETPLHIACEQKNSIEIVKFLVEKGADLTLKTRTEETPLHLACQQENSLEVVKFLLEKGLDLLIEKGADINVKSDTYEQTALHFACYRKESLNVVKLLVEKGADINLQNSQNQSPLELSYHFKNFEVTKFLLMNDANIFQSLINHEDQEQYYHYRFSKQFPKQFIDMFLQVYSLNQDLYNLLNSNEFSDLEIKSNDSFSFLVHKLILLSRFNNDQSILDKFINLCKQKSKEDVQIALDFLYTGFPGFDFLIKKINSKMIDNLVNFSEAFTTQKPEEPLDWIEKEEHIKEFFQEMQLDSNWIESKKGRKGIIKDFAKLFQNESTKDFTIICEDEQEIKVHKLILILRSELFKGMFQLNVQDSSNKVHDYSKKSIETIQQFIHFLYHDEIEKTNLNQEILGELQDIKDYYQLNQNSIIDFFLKN